MAATPATLKAGDLIEIFRGSYQHWAVYVGDGFVVHLAPPSEFAGAGSSSMMSVLAEQAIVKKEKLNDVVGKDRWKINNSLDSKYNPFSFDIIVKEANSRVGELLPYSICTRNCEHFVTELRYGKAESRQVRKAEEAVAATVVVAAAFLGIWGLVRAFGGSNKENKNKQ